MINPLRFNNRQCPAGSVPYTIILGDTLNKIALSYNTTVQEIINANPGISPNFLTVGQQICIPIPFQIYPSCPTTNYYVVRQGDTLESIAAYFNVAPVQLFYSNYGIDPNDLYEDQILCIPVSPLPISVEVDLVLRNLVVYRDGVVFRTYTVALEDPEAQIPRGTFTVIFKNVDPGVEQGARWIGLSEGDLGIHGTNTPLFVDVLSAGRSIILSNEDVSELFNLVPVGTTVRIL